MQSLLRMPAWIGRCCLLFLSLAGHVLLSAGHVAVRVLRDIAGGILRVLRWIRRILLTPIRLRGDLARRAEALWQKGRQGGTGAKAVSVLKIAGLVLLSEHGILTSVFRYAVPVLSCAFLFSVVSYGTSLDYSIEVTFNGRILGCIEDEADYTAAEHIVRRRISYASDPCEMEFSHKLRIVQTDSSRTLLTTGDLADKMLRSAAIDLTDGYGVYLEDEFLGAVADPEPIRAALEDQLSSYYNALTESGAEISDLHYAKEVTYEKGIYLAENLTDPQEIAQTLTQTRDVTRTYTNPEETSVYSVALMYSTTPDRIRALNPELPDVIPETKRITVPVTEHAIPMVYKMQSVTVSFIDYDTIRTETSRLPVGREKVLTRGVKGERRNLTEFTYIDGAETERTVLGSVLLSLPVDEQIGVGTYAAAPASTMTKLYGTGQFAWPVNGGYISDVFISNRNHRGIDIAAPAGTEIYAAEDGIVRIASVHSSYGNYIVIDHGDGYETYYAHCSVLLAAAGQEVTRGQVIALVGTTGHSTGNHLHFEVRINGLNYNPADFLRVNAD